MMLVSITLNIRYSYTMIHNNNMIYCAIIHEVINTTDNNPTKFIHISELIPYTIPQHIQLQKTTKTSNIPDKRSKNTRKQQVLYPTHKNKIKRTLHCELTQKSRTANNQPEEPCASFSDCGGNGGS